ncbi:MAG: fatty acid desaturase, partial [Gammaproteobacteria bacterium]
MKKILVNVRYFIAPLLILSAIFGVLAGGPWVWTGVALLGVGIIIDTLTRKQTPGAGYDEAGNTYAVPGLQNGVMYGMLGAFALLQIVLAWRVWEYVNGVPIGESTLLGFAIQSGISGNQLIGACLSSGIFAGIGIIYGHELAHTKGFSFVIARWMMALSGKAHFCYAHVYNHHLELGHKDDPATAPRGRSLYAHFPLSGLGQSKFLFNMEKQRLERLNKPFLTWQNRWIRGYAMSLPTVLLFWFAGGWIGMAALGALWVIANFELEALNYLEHYGLIREKGQPIDYRHSWDNNTAFTSWFFIEIGRQADHHDRGETHFWELDEVGAPNCGRGYFSLFALT